LCQRASVLLRQGQRGAALPLIEPGLSLARRLGEPHLTGRLLSARAYATYVEGDHAGAANDAAEALRLFRQAGDGLQVEAMLDNLASIELAEGDLDAARRHLAEALGIARALNARSDIVYETFNLGLAEYLDGSPRTAEALFGESLDLARRMGMKALMAYALIGVAMTGHGGADLSWPARLHGAADQALADLGETVAPLEGRLADLDRQRARATSQTLHRMPAGGETPRAGALDSEPVAAGSRAAGPVLTPRELEVLTLVAQGLSNPDIAQRLALSEHTVHRHLANILRKLGLSSRVAAAAWGARNGLV